MTRPHSPEESSEDPSFFAPPRRPAARDFTPAAAAEENDTRAKQGGKCPSFKTSTRRVMQCMYNVAITPLTNTLRNPIYQRYRG
mmetsp:Transcript_20715/g.42294  ORF Transcript_20715/g.42294 Transcript_20715/m.42294 type:complete len:84 (-) Transcript_20715:136-387(-)